MTCGIYSITSQLGAQYFGQSIDVEQRIHQHKSALLRGNHTNKRLQAEHDALGTMNFELREECSPENLTKLEQMHFDKFKPTLNQTLHASGKSRGFKLRTSKTELHGFQYKLALRRIKLSKISKDNKKASEFPRNPNKLSKIDKILLSGGLLPYGLEHIKTLAHEYRYEGNHDNLHFMARKYVNRLDK